jgi:hypothetical protein
VYCVCLYIYSQFNVLQLQRVATIKSISYVNAFRKSWGVIVNKVRDDAKFCQPASQPSESQLSHLGGFNPVEEPCRRRTMVDWCSQTLLRTIVDLLFYTSHVTTVDLCCSARRLSTTRNCDYSTMYL